MVKEWQSLLRSPQSRRLLIMPVLLQVAIFPFATTLEVRNSTLAIYNEDGGAPSVALMQRLAAAEAFPAVIMLYSDAQLRQIVDSQAALLAIRIPPDFSRKFMRISRLLFRPSWMGAVPTALKSLLIMLNRL